MRLFVAVTPPRHVLLELRAAVESMAHGRPPPNGAHRNGGAVNGSRSYSAIDPRDTGSFALGFGAAAARARQSGAPQTEHAAIEGLRWVRPDLWHITVAFLGEVAPERLDELRERLGRAASRAVPMELALARGGHFNRHTLWIGVNGDSERLARLAASVNAAARRCHIPVPDTPYRPHITLARVRGDVRREPGGSAALADLVSRIDAFRSPCWFAGEMDLIQSHQGPTPRYERLERWSLTGR